MRELDMQYCPMCNKEYNDITKMCPLEHCPNCGSIKIEKQKSRRPKKDADERILGFGLGFGVIGLLALGMANYYDPIYHLFSIPLIIVMGITAYYNSSIQNFCCKSCLSKKFSYISSIKLKKTRKNLIEFENHDVDNQEDIEYQDKDGIMKKLDTITDSQSKHHKRDLILRIAGIVVASIISVSTWIYNEVIFDFFNI